MPFYALSYHIGVRKGMEGHQDILKGNLIRKGMPSQTLHIFLEVFGRAWPYFTLTILFGGFKGYGRASNCDVQKEILILWKGLMAFWESILLKMLKMTLLESNLEFVINAF